LVEGVILAGEVEVSGKVHHARNPAAVALAKFSERELDQITRGQIDRDAVDGRLVALKIEADHRVIGLERLGERRADGAGGAGDGDDRPT
jgi:hypothetical protein